MRQTSEGRLVGAVRGRIGRKYPTLRWRKMLYLHLGLEEGSEGTTLDKIGARMVLTREKLRKIREQAFAKLRESPDGRALKGFWRAA